MSMWKWQEIQTVLWKRKIKTYRKLYIEGADIVVELDQFKYKISGYEEPLGELKESLGLELKQERIDELEAQMEAPDFWDDVTSSQFVMKELKQLKDVVESYETLEEERDDIMTMIEMGYEEEDPELVPEVKEMLEQFVEDFENLRISTLLSGEYDGEDAILSLNAGAGGTESCDWVSMLYRMYHKWAEKKGYKIQILDYLDGEVAGIKSVTMQISGENAYGYLKSEKGIHRLVRISPFNAAGKRQTSFASCDIMPDIKQDINIEIEDEEIRIDTYRASGAGGQHINKTDSAIRITHLPTGTVVQCQNERSQRQNKDKAMQMLKAKLYLLKEQEKKEELSGIRGEVLDNGWGSQIRSYVLQPYTMVKDHRTNEESGNPAAVLDGALDDFINAYLKWENLKQTKQED